MDNIAFHDIPSALSAGSPKLGIAKVGSSVVITFEGTLQQADTITGQWSNVTGASPLTIDKPAGTKFYRASR